jgi:hypothetical protein
MKKHLITAGLLVACSVSFAANGKLLCTRLPDDRANIDAAGVLDTGRKPCLLPIPKDYSPLERIKNSVLPYLSSY